MNKTMRREDGSFLIVRYTDSVGNPMDEKHASDVTVMEFDAQGNVTNIAYKFTRIR